MINSDRSIATSQELRDFFTQPHTYQEFVDLYCGKLILDDVWYDILKATYKESK